MSVEPGQLTADSPVAQVLAGHRSRVRRQWIWYAAAVSVLLVIVGTFVAVVWSRSEFRQAHRSVFRSAPADLPAAAPAATLKQAWRTDDQAATGQPVWHGVAVTSAARSVTARDALTGQPVWSYRRDDALVCTVIQRGGTTAVLWAEHGSCDQMTAFKTDTGARAWERTLFKDGHHLDGHPSVSSTDYTILLRTADLVWAIDPGSGLERWILVEPGCTFSAAVVGSAGVLISEQCGDGSHLMLRDGYRGTDDKTAQRWRLDKNSDVPVSAGSIIAAFDPTTGKLNTYKAEDGKPVASVALAPRPVSADAPDSIETLHGTVIRLGGRNFAISADGKTQLWTTTTAAPYLSLTNPEPEGTQLAATSADSTVATVDGGSGKAVRALLLEPAATDTPVAQIGAGLLMSGPDGTRAYL